MKNNILIAGGSGFIGSHITDILIHKNYNIYCIGRRKINCLPPYFLKHIKNDRVKYLPADITDLHSLKEALSKIPSIDYIINATGGGWVSTSSKKGYLHLYKYNVEGLKNLLKICLNKYLIKKVIHLGSVSSYGVQFNKIINENTCKEPIQVHEKVKFLAQRVVKRLCNKHKVPFVILQPSQVYGERDVNSEVLKILKLVKRGIFVFIGQGKNYAVPFVYVKDVAKITAILLEKNVESQEYILAWEKKTWRKIIETISKILNKHVYYVCIPVKLSLFITGICERIFLSIGKEPPLTPQRIRNMSENRLYDSSKILNEIKFSPTPFEEGMRNTIDWYIKNGLL